MKESTQTKKDANTERKTEAGRKNPETGCCFTDSMAETMANCCGDAQTESSGGKNATMSRCSKGMKIFGWLPSIPVLFGVVAILLGYFLSPEGVRILWLIVSGTVLFVGLLGFILMGSQRRTWGESRS
jgi:hypothetical protein